MVAAVAAASKAFAVQAAAIGAAGKLLADTTTCGWTWRSVIGQGLVYTHVLQSMFVHCHSVVILKLHAEPYTLTKVL